MFSEAKRSDAQLQDAMKRLFLGLAPERVGELERLWDDYQLQFCLFTDDKGVKLEGGAYRYVHFNHRALRVIWISAFAAWEAYACTQAEVGGGDHRPLCRLQELLALARDVRDACDPEAIPLRGLPEPGSLPSDSQLRVAAERAMFAAGWAMLHEVQHLKHQQDCTLTADGDPPERALEEEHSCDRFAAEYLIGMAAQYAEAHGVDPAKVHTKRALGVYFGLFALMVLAYPNWDETMSHPSVSDRLRAMRSVLSDASDEALCLAALALVGLKQVWPTAPDFAS